MINRPKLLLFILLLFAGAELRAQVNDAQLWLSVNLEKKITQSFSVAFSEELRLNENITEAGTIFSDLGVSYRFNKRFRAGVSGRYTLKRRLDDTYEQRFSWYAEGFYREKLKPVSMIFRLRYQSRYDEAGTSEKAAIPEDHLRTKLTLKIDLKKKFEPYIYGEAFFNIQEPASRSFDQLRLCAGIEYTFSRRHMVDLHYLISREYQVKNPETDYVIGASYYFTF